MTEIRAPGLIFQDERLKVTAALADHAPFDVALAYRFDTAERSIVISGDTAPSARVAALARGADVLVHEAMYVPGIDAMLAKRGYVPRSCGASWVRGIRRRRMPAASPASRRAHAGALASAARR